MLAAFKGYRNGPDGRASTTVPGLKHVMVSLRSAHGGNDGRPAGGVRDSLASAGVVVRSRRLRDTNAGPCWLRRRYRKGVAPN